MVKGAGPVPDGTLQADEAGRCVFCGRPADHVHPEPRPAKTKGKKTGPVPDVTDEEGDTDG